jgi:hypothetical protein
MKTREVTRCILDMIYILALVVIITPFIYAMIIMLIPD